MKFERIESTYIDTNYLQGIWSVETGEHEELIQVVPDGYPEIVIPLNGTIITNINGHAFPIISSSIIGQLSKSVFIKMEPHSKFISLKLYPWSLGTITQGASKSILNTIVSLDNFSLSIFKSCELFREKFIYSSSVRHLDNLLLDIFSQLSLNVKPIIKFNIINKFEEIRKYELSSDLNKLKYSRRYLEKLYAQEVGISPYRFSKILKVKKLTLELKTKKNVNIAILSDLFGYYDTSHLYKDFKSIVTHSPKNHLAPM